MSGALGGEANYGAGQVGASFSPGAGAERIGNSSPRSRQPPLCPAVAFRVRGRDARGSLPPSARSTAATRMGNTSELPRWAVQPRNPSPAHQFFPNPC